ncbi:N-acetylglucosamine-6-phosphate deacetylase [Cohnella rhizosphaerae]|uniref:Amidohydrolase family protein n=1 Tax=Cohnella rhizosphaerae TaxID=1457232 RepID=A0A9X4KS21_9BACL|nr:amidohydrolase family protein [Cohnella rhizosphaerae]MDG0809643.1 amidohydrolase family protein [Cohnella rhizosphaerae]
METIVCGKVVTPFSVIEKGMVVVKDGRIAEVGERVPERLVRAGNVLDRQGEYIVPGFVDIHCHGGGGCWSFDEPERFAEFHLRRGTTGILPTLFYNQSHAEILEGLARVQAVMAQGGSSILGIHLEGPYINSKYGAVTAPIRSVNQAEYREILEMAGKEILLWTLAPELDGQTAFMEEASRYGIVFSVGHSEADPETIFAAHRLGLRLGCHLTNASGVTPNQSRYAGTREVGVHEAVLAHDEMYAEVIPDANGIHVRPLMLRLIVKAKGVDSVIVITDSVDLGGTVPGQDVNLIRGNEFSPNGEDLMLSGSLLTMDRAVHNMRKHTGIGMVDACKMGALNPARLLGLDRDLGSIERGKIANLLAVTEDMDVQMVMLEGHLKHLAQNGR